MAWLTLFTASFYLGFYIWNTKILDQYSAIGQVFFYAWRVLGYISLYYLTGEAVILIGLMKNDPVSDKDLFLARMCAIGFLFLISIPSFLAYVGRRLIGIPDMITDS